MTAGTDFKAVTQMKEIMMSAFVGTDDNNFITFDVILPPLSYEKLCITLHIASICNFINELKIL